MIAPELFASTLSLCAAAAWGAADFSGAIATRSANALGVVRIAHGTGFVFMVVLAVLTSDPFPSSTALLWGAAAGVAGAVGLVSLYRALAIGKMGINAPVAAVISATLPVAFGVWTEGAPGALQLTGFGVALGAIWFIALPEGDVGRPKGLGLAMLAGVGFSGFLLFSRLAGTESVYWPLAAARAASVALISVVLVVRRPDDGRPPRAMLPYMLAAGVLDSLGNALFVLATHHGRLDVAAVLSSLYPASTVLLARVVLKERVSRVQLVGMVAALAAVVMIAR
jgi:drug/metabolite transporter (DMT)-like permease